MTTDGAYTTIWTIVQRARTGHVGDFLTDEVCHLARKSSSQLFFRAAGACRFPTFFPRLVPWAAFLRRFAASS